MSTWPSSRLSASIASILCSTGLRRVVDSMLSRVVGLPMLGLLIGTLASRLHGRHQRRQLVHRADHARPAGLDLDDHALVEEAFRTMVRRE